MPSSATKFLGSIGLDEQTIPQRRRHRTWQAQ